MEYIVLGLIQGLTEFFPISSSAHLVIIKNILNIREESLPFFVWLHLGTTFSLIVFFFKDILRTLKDKKILFYIAISVFISGGGIFLEKDLFEELFKSLNAVGIALISMGIILLLSKQKRLNNSRGFRKMNLLDVFLFSLVQIFSALPGISRSGITISCLLLRKIDPQEAFRFSFLASIPLIIIANFWELKGMNVFNISYTTGIIASFLSGVITLGLLSRIIKKKRFYLFGYYCLSLGLFILILL